MDHERDIEALRVIGRIVARCLQQMARAMRPGMTTAELDEIGARFLTEHGATSAPRATYDFPGATCISVNEEVAHGVPGDRKLELGDLVNIDVSAELDGYWADTGGSFGVGEVPQQLAHLCDTTKRALNAAMRNATAGKPLRGIGKAIEKALRPVASSSLLLVLGAACPGGPTTSPDDGVRITSFFVEIPEVAALYAGRDPVLQQEIWWVDDPISHCSFIELPLEDRRWRRRARRAADRSWHKQVDAEFAAQVRQLDDTIEPLGYDEGERQGKYGGTRNKNGEPGFVFDRSWGFFRGTLRSLWESRRELRRLYAKQQRVFKLAGCVPWEGDAEHLPTAMMDLLRSLPEFALGLRFMTENEVLNERLDVWWSSTEGLSAELRGRFPAAKGDALAKWLSDEQLWDFISEGGYHDYMNFAVRGHFFWTGEHEGNFYFASLGDYREGDSRWYITVESPNAPNPWP